MGDHRAQEAKGRVKEAAGSLTDRDDLVGKGRDDRSKAKVKRTVGDAKNKARQKVEQGRDKVSAAADRATRRR